MLTGYQRLFAAALAILTGLLAFAACAHQENTQEQVVVGRGAELFAKNCLVCHGAPGSATRIGRSLAGEGHRKSLAAITEAIEDPQPPMPKLYPGTLSQSDVSDIAAYVKTL
jgi:mono/diheme cytochrome c family protein